MAKINSFIAEYKECIGSAGICAGSGVPTKRLIRGFMTLFRQMDDKRVQGMISYPLEEIVLIAFLAVLGGASTWEEIVAFGREKEHWLKKFIRLKNGIPSHDTFRRVFSLINSKQLQAITVQFLLSNLYSIKKALGISDNGYRHICVDGKEQNGTGKNYDYADLKKPNLQTLHVYDSTNGICLYSEAISKKTNEIPVAQKLLENMNLKDCIVTFDAMHTQKKTVEIIRAAKGHYVGGVKENQLNLLEEASAYFDDECKAFYKEKGDYFETREKAHSQIETRKYYLVRPSKSPITKQWKDLAAFVCFEKTIDNTRNKKTSTETRYYVSSLDDIELCAEAIRGHWSVENQLHWQLDAAFDEDDNTTEDVAAFNNLSLLNKMALSLCKLASAIMPKRSIKTIRKAFSWNYEENLTKLFSAFDEEAIERAIRKCTINLKGVNQTLQHQ